MARPSSYKPEYAEQAEKLCLLGATDKELADFFGVSEQTVNNWKKSEPEFLESLKAGKIAADRDVADKLFQRATGYEWEEEQAVKIKVGQYEEKVEIVTVLRAVPPDTTAAIFWLKNRRPKQWRDKVEQDINHGVQDSLAEVMREVAGRGRSG